MVLDSSIFPAREALLDDENRMVISPAVECIITNDNGSYYTGSIFNIFDRDTSTDYAYGYSSVSNNVNRTITTTLKFSQKRKTKVLWIYWGCHASSDRGGEIVTTLQISEDNTTWTDIDTLTCTLGTTKYNTYTAENITFRYIRLSSLCTCTAGAGSVEFIQRFYEISFS